VETFLLKQLSKKGLDIKSLDRKAREYHAWRWLIISYNHANKVKRVRLHPKLTVSYERKREVAPPSFKADETAGILQRATQSLVDALKSRQEEKSPAGPVVPEDGVLTILGSFWNAAKWFSANYAEPAATPYKLQLKKDGNPNFQKCVDRWNTLFDDADKLLSGSTIQVRDFGEDEIPHLQEVEDLLRDDPLDNGITPEDEAYFDQWEKDHPESFDKDGLSFFREDIDLVNINEGQTFVSMKHNDVNYYAIVGHAQGPPKSAKAKGKTPVKPKSPLRPRSQSPVKSGPAAGEKPSEHPLEQDNPLRVKGEPKSKALSEGQRKQLRSFFKLEEESVPADRWATLSSKEKANALKERSIPRWATEVVLRDGRNLPKVLAGEITKENANSAPRSPKVARTKQASAALEAWLQLKSDFKGTPLLKRPQTGKEKAFYKRYASLVEAYGEQPSFPKPRDSPGQQGQASSRGNAGAARNGQLGDLIDLAKAFGEISRAFRGA
jgi:hypothetical protein